MKTLITTTMVAALVASAHAAEEKSTEDLLKKERTTKQLLTKNKWVIVNKDGSPKKGKEKIIQLTSSGKITDKDGKQLPKGEFRYWEVFSKDKKGLHRFIIKKERKSGWYTFTYNASKDYWQGV